MFTPNNIENIGLSVFSNFIFQLLIFISVYVFQIFNSNRGKFILTPLLNLSAIITPIIIIPASLILYNLDKIKQETLVTTIIYLLSISFIYLSCKIINFRKVGILSLDVNISRGINYKRALNLTKRNLKFLGTGADKLTSCQHEFNEAISSASRQNRAKFLLCHPDSAALLQMAQDDGKDKNEYVNNVKRSLSKLKEIAERTEKIEVRFYKADIPEKMPVFRLMFFNDNHCLCSFNSFGNKDKGTTSPQLHLSRPTNHNGRNLYYSAFDKYFEDLWTQCEDNKVLQKEDWQKIEV